MEIHKHFCMQYEDWKCEDDDYGDDGDNDDNDYNSVCLCVAK